MKKILYIIGVMLAVASCTKTDEFQNPNNGEGAVQFTAGTPTTRVTENSEWQADDPIGIFADNTSGTAIASNSHYKIKANNSGEMEYVSGDKIYPPKMGSMDYYAYYPYGTVTNNKLNIDLTTSANQKPLVYAKEENISGANVSLRFTHQLVKLNLTFTAGGVDITTLSGATATLKGANTKGQFDVKTGAWDDAQAAVADIPLTIASSGTSKTVTVYVMPTTSPNANTSVIITAGGKTFGWKPTTTIWMAGETYNYNITVGELPPPKIRDYYYGGGVYSSTLLTGKTPIGIIFSVGADGKSGKVVSLDEENKMWNPNSARVETGANSENNGRYNMKVVVGRVTGDKVFNEINFPAFWWVHQKNVNATAATYTTEAKEIWYVPSAMELRELFAGYCGLQWVESGATAGQINDWGRYSMPGHSEVHSSAKSRFNGKIRNSEVEDAKVLSSENYLSSTEDGPPLAKNMSFRAGWSSSGGKENEQNVRAILAFEI